MTTDAAHDLPPEGVSVGASWERAAGARRRVTSLLRDLPAGFVVFHDIELPKPTRAVVEHLVVGPRNIWAVTTHVVDDPVTHGRGRNADTLFAGKSSLRPELEAADWEASALSDLLGHPVEPVVVLVAPDLPAASFDLHGVRVCEPRTLMRQVATSTSDYVDVGAVLAAAERAFGVQPNSAGPLPRLGSATLSPALRPAGPPRVRRSLGARLHAARRHTVVRLGALVAVVVAGIIAAPTIRSLWSTVADEGSDAVAGAFASDSAAEPASVGVVFTCAGQGSAWELSWRWPGTPVEGAVGFHVVSRAGVGSAVRHTTAVWSDPSMPPPPIGAPSGVETIVDTQHVAADGTVLATGRTTVQAPATTC